MSENEQFIDKNTDPYLFREDIEAVYRDWMPVAVNQIKKDYSANRMGRKTAIAQQQVWEKGRSLLLHISDLGLTPDIIIDWLDREMTLCHQLAEQKETITAAQAA